LRRGCLASGELRQRGYGEHYAGYGVDEEGLEAAYDAGAYGTARSTRATAVSPRAYDSEPYDEHIDGPGVTYAFSVSER